ncbi:hypothetical protein ANPL_03415 [Anaplasma platys]|uniref:DNA-protecting protein DprA n=1 Tax=Anaplasma platys TaxID=949 RepID=A0A858PYQ5_9RICK|nr:DNA-processing protein DprA [Anaplasma platys]QJC27741.1 hypothetical protein ANPL_03415 [Anaplasma platys]
MNTCDTKKADELISCLRLARTPKVGPVMFRKLMELFKTPTSALEALAAGECRDIKAVCSQYDAEKELDLCERIGASVISIFDPQYPKMLAHIFDPPPVITVLGNKELLSHPHILAIVGSRGASTNGQRMAFELSLALTRAGFVTVSGLARGVDSAVHSIAYKKMPTIAVVANGINVIYPRENAKLYKTIVGEGGLLVSELPFSSLPKSHLFPQRNRLISGLSMGVVVVEASRKSGSLITANLAISHGREVFAVPGSPLDEGYSGSNDLIKQGATLVENADDILNAFGIFSPQNGKSRVSAKEQTEVHHKDTPPANVQEFILRHLSTTPTNVDDLVALSRISINILLASMLELELAGKLERLPGNRVALTKKHA